MLNQFSRTELLFGKEAMEKLANSRVAVFGSVVFLDNLCNLIRKDFDSGNVSVDADAHLMESHIQKELLCLIYHAEFFLTG